MEKHILGAGNEADVYRHPTRPDQVLKLMRREKRESPLLVKGRFYFTRVLHLIFPEHVPDIHCVTSAPFTISTTLKETDSRHQVLREWKLKTLRREEVPWREERAVLTALDSTAADPAYKKTIEELEEVASGSFDKSQINFSYDEDHHMVYLDSFVPWRPVKDVWTRMYHVSRMQEKIDSMVSEDKKRMALKYFQRLEELFEQIQKQDAFFR